MKHNLLAKEILESLVTKGEIAWWWLGQSGFVYKTENAVFVIDPYLSDHLERITRGSHVNQHNRMTPIPITPEQLVGVDYICCTHDHLDHYDPETVIPMLAVNPSAKVVIPRAAKGSLLRDGIEESRIITVDTRTNFVDMEKGIQISAVKGKHNEFDYSDVHDYPYLGFIIKAGAYRVYHAGDTILFPELTTLVLKERPDLAFLPINGGDEDRRKRGFMSNLQFYEAADLGKQILAKLVIPCHYDMFDINTEQIGRFVNYANTIGLNYVVPMVGEKYTYRGELEWI